MRPIETNLEKKAGLIAERVRDAKCDVIAVQEILADDVSSSNKYLAEINSKLNTEEEVFRTFTSDDYGSLKLGILYNQDKFKFLNSQSSKHYLLPKFSRYERNSYFTRAPLIAEFMHLQSQQKILFVNIHMKSASVQSGFDSSGYTFEIERMKAAQAVSDIIAAGAGHASVKIVLGDFNAEYHSASAGIIRNELNLEMFRNKQCQLSENGAAECSVKLKHSNSFVSLADNSRSSISRSYFKKKAYSLIDDILIKAQYGVDPKKWDDGYLQAAPEVSDHPLLWSEVILN